MNFRLLFFLIHLLSTVSRTSSANSFSAWGVKKTIKEEQNLSPRGTRTEDQAQDEVKTIPSPQSGPADGRDKSTGADNNKGSATPFVSPPRTRTRSNSKGDSEASLHTHKRSHSRVRSLFALGSNKIERDQPEEELNDTHDDEGPAAHETPFPGIRLHQQHEAASDSPFPGIRLRICTEEDRGSGSVTSPSQDDENTDNTTKVRQSFHLSPHIYFTQQLFTFTRSSFLSRIKTRFWRYLRPITTRTYGRALVPLHLIFPQLGDRTSSFARCVQVAAETCLLSLLFALELYLWHFSQEGDEEKLIMEWCAPTMLRLVPLPNVIVLLRALLQEYKVVLLCKNLGVLSFIA